MTKSSHLTSSSIPVWQDIMLRGGRLTKIAGQTVSLSPSMGRILGSASISALTLGAALTMGGTAAVAQAVPGDNLIVTIDAGGSTAGVDANHTGTGYVSITATVGVSSNDVGIDATNSSNGTDLTINATDVLALESGIDANNDGSGALSIATTGGVYGLENGIAANNSSNGTDLTITAVNVDGQLDGINANNDGSGEMSITATGYLSSGEDGIVASNDGTDLTINVADVSANYSGISGHNNGSGALNIAATGSVTGRQRDGIVASNNGTDLTINVVDVTADWDAISAYNEGSGDLSITATGTVTGDEYGILGVSYGSDLTINATNVDAEDFGIVAINAGSGALSVTSSGTVTGAEGAGVIANNSWYDGQAIDSGATDLTVAVHDVFGDAAGISARNYGSGALSVTSTGTVSGRDDTIDSGFIESHGIDTLNVGTDLTITAVNVDGHLDGIHADNDGSGALSVTATGTVTGGEDGIHADNDGSGALSITATDTVTGSDYGISATNDGTDLTINVADVGSDFGTGIDADNYGSGALSITATGTVDGDVDGIDATNSSNGTDLTINAVDVTGYGQYSGRGIHADNEGSGALSITATGEVYGGEYGIVAINEGTDLTIDVADVESSDGDGIHADNNGSGALSITGGRIFGNDVAVVADNSSNGTDLTINVAGAFSPYVSGVDANNDGSGALSITATGGVYGFSTAISAANDGTDLTINVVGVSSGFGDSIDADNDGSGVLSITATGTVDGRNGINASNSSNGTDLTINVADVYGDYDGIDADNDGSGALSITATGTVTGRRTDGISATNDGTDLTINVADVSGREDGINADNDGSGALSITATGTVTGREYGISATNDGTDLTINVADIDASFDDGINADNDGNGALSITATGTVRSLDDGIVADNSNTGTDLTINVVDVFSAYATGISANNDGSGALSITATGNYLFGLSNGINAANNGTDLTINVADVEGDYGNGIHADNDGSGALSITATGTVMSRRTDGISATNDGTDLTINVADVEGYYGDGINADNDGSGALSITATGTVTGGGDGIYAANSSTGTDLAVSVADVSAARRAVHVQNEGSGETTIEISGALTSGGGYYDVTTGTISGQTGTITLSSGAVVGSNGMAIEDSDGDTTVIVEEGATLAGAISMGNGDDGLTFLGGDFSGLTDVDGGEGTDTLSFLGTSSGSVGDGFTNWEVVELSSGSNVSFDEGSLEIADLIIARGGSLNAAGGLALTGDLTNNGTVNSQDGTAGDEITVSGDYESGGELQIDVDFASGTSDTLVIAGDVNSGTTSTTAEAVDGAVAAPSPISSSTTYVTISDVSSGFTRRDGIVVVDVAGSTSEGDFALTGGTITSGAYDYALDLSDTSWILAGEVNGTGAAYEGFAQSLASFTALASLQQRQNARQWFSDDVVEQGAWIQMSGATSSGSLVSSTNSAYDTNVFTLQVGYDIHNVSSALGTWVFGVSGIYSSVNTSLSFDGGAGSVSSAGYTLGASATWEGLDNLYVDLQGQMTWIDSDIMSSTSGELAGSHNSNAYALSAEIGKAIAVSENGTLIPQAQLTFATLDGGSLTDNTGSDVDFGSNDSITARLGMVYEMDLQSIGTDGKGYVLGNLTHVSADAATVDVAGDALSALTDGNWFEIGAGGSMQLDETKSLFAEASYKTGLGGNFSDSEEFGLRVGMQLDW